MLSFMNATSGVSANAFVAGTVVDVASAPEGSVHVPADVVIAVDCLYAVPIPQYTHAFVTFSGNDGTVTVKRYPSVNASEPGFASY